MSVFKGRVLTAAIVSLLEDADLLVGEGDEPTGAGWQGSPGASVFKPYVVVTPVPGGVFDGTLAAPFADARPDYIVASYAATQAQAQFTNDTVYNLLTTSTLSVAGQSVQLVAPDVEGGVIRDDDVTPTVFYAPTRWRVFMTPS